MIMSCKFVGNIMSEINVSYIGYWGKAVFVVVNVNWEIEIENVVSIVVVMLG